jgi:hypothetical protein
VARLTLALAAMLLFGGPVCAQQAWHLPNPPEAKKGLAKPIPAWNIHGHAEEIPSWIRPATVVASESSWLRSCVIVAKHGKKYDSIEGFAVQRTAPLKKLLRKRDLNELKAKGGLVEILPQRYSKSDLQSAQNACFR